MDDLKAKLDALSAKATQGEWEVCGDSLYGEPWISADGEIVAAVTHAYPECVIAMDAGDVRFIATLVNAYRAGTIGDTAAADKAGYERGLREAAGECSDQRKAFLSPEYATGQPISSMLERFACAECEKAIIAKLETPDER